MEGSYLSSKHGKTTCREDGTKEPGEETYAEEKTAATAAPTAGSASASTASAAAAYPWRATALAASTEEHIVEKKPMEPGEETYAEEKTRRRPR